MTYPSHRKTVLIGKESTLGTAVTADKDIGLVQDITDDMTREVINTMGLGALAVQQVHGGTVDTGSSFTVKLQHGRLFEYIIGAVAHDDSDSPDIKHTFTQSNTPPSFTLESSENGSTDTALTFAGNIVDNAELSIALNEELKLKVVTKSIAPTSSATAAAATLSSLQTFPHSLVTITINSSEATQVQSFSVKFNKGVQKTFGISANLPQSNDNNELTYEFSGTLGFSNKVYQELFMGGSTVTDSGDPTTYNIVIDADNGVSAGSGKRQIKLTLTSAMGASFSKAAAIGDLIFVEMSGNATLSELITYDNIASGSW